MKTVCEVLGVARSAVAVKRARSSDWRDGRRARVTNDAGLVEEQVIGPRSLRVEENIERRRAVPPHCTDHRDDHAVEHGRLGEVVRDRAERIARGDTAVEVDLGVKPEAPEAGLAALT